MPLIPFPYDVIGHWMSKHKVELSQEAYLELAELFIKYSAKVDNSTQTNKELI